MQMKRLFDHLFKKADSVPPIQPAVDKPDSQFALPGLHTPAERKKGCPSGPSGAAG